MGIEILFESKGDEKNKDRVVHVIFTDGCYSSLTESEEKLSTIQKASIALEEDKTRRKYLLKMCTTVVNYIFNINDGAIDLYCPKCKNNYVVTEEQFSDALADFVNHKIE